MTERFKTKLIQILKAIEKEIKKRDMLLINCGVDLANYENAYSSALLDLVKDLLNDKNSMLDWWLYDSVSGERFIWDSNGNKIDLNKPEKLVEYLLDE